MFGRGNNICKDLAGVMVVRGGEKTREMTDEVGRLEGIQRAPSLILEIQSIFKVSMFLLRGLWRGLNISNRSQFVRQRS